MKRILILALLAVAAVATSASQAQAQARPAQCTQYVAAVRGLMGYPNAFQWAGAYLGSRGFRQVAFPVVGAVVVYQPGAYGTDASFGHVAVVRYVWGAANGRSNFWFQGA